MRGSPFLNKLLDKMNEVKCTCGQSKSKHGKSHSFNVDKEQTIAIKRNTTYFAKKAVIVDCTLMLCEHEEVEKITVKASSNEGFRLVKEFNRESFEKAGIHLTKRLSEQSESNIKNWIEKTYEKLINS